MFINLLLKVSWNTKICPNHQTDVITLKVMKDTYGIDPIAHFQAACCLNIWLCAIVSFVCQNKFQATSKQGWRQSFGMLTYLTNIRSNSIAGRMLRFNMLTALTNIRSTKVLHHASCIMHLASCIMHCSQEHDI